MNYVETITINPYQDELFKTILSITEGDCPDYGHDAIIHVETAIFENGYQADIKLCNGETPYVDYVLFDKHGNQMDVLEIDEEFTGSFEFSSDNDTYTVHVTVETNEVGEK